jgi:intein/homing endonuclease
MYLLITQGRLWRFRHVLRALFSVDSTIENDSLILQSDSQPLLQDVQLLLLGFGVQSAICTNGDGGAVADGGLSDRPIPRDGDLHGPRGDAAATAA